MDESDGRAAVTVQRSGAPTAAAGTAPVRDAAGGIYDEVHRSPAFREVRRRYRRFVLPATAAFLGWYLAYVLAATLAPGLMARPVAGAVNVAMVAGLAQFATTFLLTWAYARHARLRRDPAAMELRWAVTLETLPAGRPERLALTAGTPERESLR
ncbi:DUF485 domain-containing protein [Streptomyces griseocarneus]|uniref:DUF485 domain-containing protein n=1 Tax=Streptomyces griseocarneus TaxID=51201 RepID=UPI0019B87053|nr:DUF485 domain-containing protein [Streptomyces griseocarneus]MBZ6472419.1 DUF485 domain-containing protein [Streptomyces griseocarneus]GHG45066.1 hypothetical protein GCM10018779_00690 [Streptomyces griseocarneus]